MQQRTTFQKAMWILAAIVLAAILLSLFSLLLNQGKDHGLTRLTDGWTVTQSGMIYENQRVDYYLFPDGALNYGDSITFTRIFKAESRPPYMLRFKSNHAGVVVRVKGSPIFVNGLDRVFSRRLVGGGIFSVPVPYDALNQPISITFYPSFHQTVDRIDGFELLSSERAYSDYMARHGYSLFIGIFLVVFGFISLVFGALMLGFERGYLRLSLIGFMSLLIGLWSMCYARVIQVCFVNYVAFDVIEHLCLYVMPLPFLLLVMNLYKRKVSAWKWRMLKGLVFSNIAFVLVTIFCHLTNIAFYSNFLPFFHVAVVGAFVSLLVFGLLLNRRMEMSEKIFSIGVFIFALISFWDLIRFNVQQKLFSSNFFLENTWVPLGALLFIFFLVLSYVVYIYAAIIDRVEKEALADLAYKDSLTGLFNRTKCEQIFSTLNQRPFNFAIMSIDMNGLKAVNDAYGHTCGDEMIKVFAKVLTEAFQGVGTAVRIGGDEFVGIVREEHVREVPLAIEKMLQLEKQYSEGLPVPLSASYGVAERAACGGANASNVYRVADAKMYAMKMEEKKKQKVSL